MPICAQLVEVGAEDLDRDRRGDAAEHVAEAVGERPHDHAEGAGHGLALSRAMSSRISRAAAAFRLPSFAELHVELHGDTGTTWSPRSARPSAAADLSHFGDAEQHLLLDDVADSVHLVERGAGRGGGGDGGGFLLEGGQEILAHQRIEQNARDDDHADDAEQQERLAKAEAQAACFRASHFIARTSEAVLVLVAFLRLEQERAEHRNRGERNDERRDHQMMVAMAMGANSRPSTPVSPSSGRKTRMMRMVA